MKNKHKWFLLSIVLILFVTFVFSLVVGDIEIPFVDSIKALFQQSTDYFNNVITSIRLPRTMIAMLAGATLALSGLLTSIALRNPLADSGVLGIQSGATVGALIALLVFPSFAFFLPLFAFIGGFVAFSMLIFASYKEGFKASKVILVGVAINAFATALIGIITMMNADRVKNALTWLNGSVANVTRSQMQSVLLFSIVAILLAFSFAKVVKMLYLPDEKIRNIGQNPKKLRIGISVLAVILASISVSYVGVLSFVGIIAPQIVKRFVRNDLFSTMMGSMILGAILVAGVDVIQRLLFSPIEIPVGVLIGLLGAPLFIGLANFSSSRGS